MQDILVDCRNFLKDKNFKLHENIFNCKKLYWIAFIFDFFKKRWVYLNVLNTCLTCFLIDDQNLSIEFVCISGSFWFFIINFQTVAIYKGHLFYLNVHARNDHKIIVDQYQVLKIKRRFINSFKSKIKLEIIENVFNFLIVQLSQVLGYNRFRINPFQHWDYKGLKKLTKASRFLSFSRI